MTNPVPAATKLTAGEIAELRAHKQSTGEWPTEITKLDGTYEIFLEACELHVQKKTTPAAPTPEPST